MLLASGAQEEGVAQLQCKQPEGLVALMPCSCERLPLQALPAGVAVLHAPLHPSRPAGGPAPGKCAGHARVVHVPPLWGHGIQEPAAPPAAQRCRRLPRSNCVQRMHHRPPPFVGRTDLETLLASDNAADWCVRVGKQITTGGVVAICGLPRPGRNAECGAPQALFQQCHYC